MKLSIQELTGMSVWAADGTPLVGTTKGATRSGLYLLPLTAVGGQVQGKFISACSTDDGKQYDGAAINEIRYIGWVWVPTLHAVRPDGLSRAEAYRLWSGQSEIPDIVAGNPQSFDEFVERLKAFGFLVRPA